MFSFEKKVNLYHTEKMNKSNCIVKNIVSIHHEFLIGKFTGDLFHEVNNIVGASTGFAQLAQLSMKEDDVKRLIDVVIKAAGKIKELSRSAQTYVSDNSENENIVNIASIISECVHLARKSFNKKGAKLSFENIGVTSVLANSGQLRHAILSLISFLFENLFEEGSIYVKAIRNNDRETKISFNYENINYNKIEETFSLAESNDFIFTLSDNGCNPECLDGLISFYIFKNKLNCSISCFPDSIQVLLKETNNI